jgi:tRNA (5-methylaminomethyl-2-thiouridylate)-methyltransferase
MKIAVLVSGGVDSSVSLALLKAQGFEVTAFYLKIWLEDELSYLGSCPWEDDLFYVRQVCEQLKVPLEVISLQKEYWDQVVRYTIDQVKKGRTPNPDIMCNQRIKFGVFLQAMDASFDRVASGHYAQVVHDTDGAKLMCSPDSIKDQTYFLSYLTQRQLSRLVLPIGHWEKAQVRHLAMQYNLPNMLRKDSQGICFLGKLKFNDFLNHYLGQVAGEVREFETNKVIGEHKGFWYHTIGQRRGSGLAGGPWYVVEKDVARNIVYMSRSYNNEEKKRNMFIVTECNWIAEKPPTETKLQVKIRHGAMKYSCLIDQDVKQQVITVTLDAHDQGIASGQFAVFYAGSVCLGAGVII